MSGGRGRDDPLKSPSLLPQYSAHSPERTLSTARAKQILEAHQDRNAVFFSDPIGGDQIIITDNPATHEKGQSDTVAGLLLTLDFEIYEGNGPVVTIV